MMRALPTPDSTGSAGDGTAGPTWATMLNSAVAELQGLLVGSADIAPTVPNARDDEFGGASTVVWSNTPAAPAASEINTFRPGHLHLKSNVASPAAYSGVVQPAPTTYPFTITTKLASTSARGNYQRGGGIIIAPSAPTTSSQLVYVGEVFNASLGVQRVSASFDGTFGSQSTAIKGYGPPAYLKVVVNSATSMDTYVSVDGWVWTSLEATINPGFTPGVIGLAVNSETAGGQSEAFFDFFRVK